MSIIEAPTGYGGPSLGKLDPCFQDWSTLVGMRRLPSVKTWRRKGKSIDGQ
jgi:hypothetical protein